MITSRTALLGFRRWPRRVCYRNRRHILQSHEIKLLERLVVLARTARAHSPADTSWLMQYRDLFRRISECVSPATLACVLERTPDDAIRRMVIWLLGRQHGSLGTKAIASVARCQDVALRREAARALKRKQAWAELRELYRLDPDPRVHRLAEQHGAPALRQRLNTFLEDVTPLTCAPSQRPVKVLVDLRNRPGCPPKTSYFIRRILDHIHTLIHSSSALASRKKKLHE